MTAAGLNPVDLIVAAGRSAEAQHRGAGAQHGAVVRHPGPRPSASTTPFPDDSGRQAHLSGQVAQALADNTGTLFAQPTIEPVDVIAEKPPI